MTELEKLEVGIEYCFFDDEISKRKEDALIKCRKFNSIDPDKYSEQLNAIKEILGSASGNVYIQPNFNCDYGKNIHVGKDFIANYNVTILDIAPVVIGDYCMIGPNTLITTVGHPISAKGRREKKAQGKKIVIGDNVWIGGNCTILPDVSIGNNVVVAAGAVVTKSVPDNCIVGGIPAKIIKYIEDES
ncbi:sugar O-acetyltransferase [Breznakia pachnodae]|uniref:Acetyltransferase n=1 Tax=Breznakia pachnodae TaxID=265178 RepID=A0ABU0E3K0_9FIRM|nr:sugar O-acetyltransferase [Breznakia pachnodae]MDQ0361471.1 maltose O-acetyltransferase [Breznakia pachnodae]